MQSLAWWVVVFSFPFWQRLSLDIQPWVSCSPHRWSSDRVQDSLKGSDFLQSFPLSPLFSGRKFPPEIKTLSLFSSFIFRCDSPSAPPMHSRCSLPLWFSVFITSVHTFKPPPAFNYHPSSSHLPPAISLQVSPARSAPTTMLLLNLPSDLLVPLHLPVLLFTSSPPTLPSSSSFLRSVGNSRCDSSLCRELHTSPV